MSKIEVKHPERKFTAGAYSSGVICDGWLYISGQGPLNLATGEIIRGSIQEETALTLSHIEKILKAAGCTRDDVVKCTCYLSDIKDFDGFNEEYGKFFTGIRPARSTVQAALWGDIKVEIDAIARVGA